MSYSNVQDNILFAIIITYTIFQMSGGDLWSMKVMHTLQKCYYSEALLITMKFIITPTETSLTAMMFIS